MVRRANDIAVQVITTPESRGAARGAAVEVFETPKGLFPGLIAPVATVGWRGRAPAKRFRSSSSCPTCRWSSCWRCSAARLAYGLWSAVAASLLSFLAYNFFFIPPIYTFTVASPQELLSLLVFLAVAVFTGTLAGRVRDQTEAVRQRAQTFGIALRLFAQAGRAPRSSTTCFGPRRPICKRSPAAAVALLIPEDGRSSGSRVAWPPDVRTECGRNERRALGLRQERDRRLAHRYAADPRHAVPPACSPRAGRSASSASSRWRAASRRRPSSNAP